MKRSDEKSFYVNYFAHRYPTFSIDVDDRDDFFVTSSYDNTVRLFSFENNQPLRILAAHSDSVLCVSFVPGLVEGVRSLVASASADKTIRLWSQDQASPVRVYHCLNSFPTVLSYCKTKNILACGSVDKKVSLIDVRNDKTIESLNLQDFTPYSLDFDVSGNVLVGGSNGIVKIFTQDACKYTDDAKCVFSVPGYGNVYYLKAENLQIPYSLAVVADL